MTTNGTVASPKSISALVKERGGDFSGITFGLLDDMAKREIRRSLLKGVALPGYQVQFGSREMPIARGWGTGGLQLTLSIIGPDDVLKVIDQGDDASVNATNLRRLIQFTTGAEITTRTSEATVIQSRHRIPEEVMDTRQVLVLQVPIPEPLRMVERSLTVARQMHGERDYAPMYLSLYEDIVRKGQIAKGAGYPVMVNSHYIMAPSPIPRWDNLKLHMADTMFLFGAGREKRIYVVPPFTRVEPLQFEDYSFKIEDFTGKKCAICGADNVFLDEVPQQAGDTVYVANDSDFRDSVLEGRKVDIEWATSS